MKSYINLFRNYANFSGFLKRGAYWTALLIHLLILLAPLTPAVLYLVNENYMLPGFYIPWVLPFWCFYLLLTRIPLLSAAVRRFHTLPRKGWWLLVGLIPVAGWFIVLIWLLQKGNYESFEKRMVKLLPSLVKNTNRPKQGGWFFAVFALLAAGGFFLNRQIMKSEPVLAAVRNIQAGVPLDTVLSDLSAGKGTVGSAKNTDEGKAAVAPVFLLEPAEGEAMISLRDGSELLPVSDSVLASRFAVTYGQYSKCVQSGVCEMPVQVTIDAYRTLDKKLFAFLRENGLKIGAYIDLMGQPPLGYAENLPMVDVTADQAALYCEWAGMRLPTADEWMAAAEGAPVSAEDANFIGYPDRWIYMRDSAQKKAQLAMTVPVSADETHTSVYGIAGMTGNVWEWTAPEQDTLTVKAMGGAWNSYPLPSLEEAVLETRPGYAANNIGFRCFADADSLTSDLFAGGSAVPMIEAQEIEAETLEAEAVGTGIEAAEIEEAEIESEPAPAVSEIGGENRDAKTRSEDDIDASKSGAVNADEDDTAGTGTTDAAEPDSESSSLLDSLFSMVNRKKSDPEAVDEGKDELQNEPEVQEEAAAEESADRIQLSEGASVTAKTDGTVLRQTENGVLAAVYAVTVGQYAECADAEVCVMPEMLEKRAYPGILDSDDAKKLPMVFVTRDQAAAYCEWAGMRLPTAEEWKAAAVLPDGRKLDETSTNCVGTDRSTLGTDPAQTALTVPVTAFRRSNVSVYGMVQMAGNVWEWAADSERAGTASAFGGAWNSYHENAGADAELETLEDYAADNIGFRCFADADMLTADRFEISEVSPAVLANPDLWRDEGIRVKDDAEMAYIPASAFTMGVSGGAVDEKPAHEVSLSAYWIDIYEVTNGQYELCVADGACTEPYETKSFRNASYYGDPAFANYPVIAVDRAQAEAYCTWANTRLPTEAEWEYAAKGPDGNAYPWGNDFQPKSLNYSGNGNYDTLAVGAFPEDVSAFGVYDLGGNVSEWILDRYQENWYSVTDQPADPTGPAVGNYYVIRGGSAQTAENNARTADRFYALSTSYGLDRGFRCAVSDDQ